MVQNSEISTIKLEKSTKKRLEKLKSYKRETYEELVQKMLEILNLCRTNPERARAKLIGIDRQNRKIKKKVEKKKAVKKQVGDN